MKSMWKKLKVIGIFDRGRPPSKFDNFSVGFPICDFKRLRKNPKTNSIALLEFC